MNWYKESEYFSGYGAWLAPDGTLTNVPGMNKHESVAQQIAKEKKIKVDLSRDYAGSALRKNGYITLTFMGGMAVWYDVQPTDIQVEKLASLFRSRIGGRDYVRIVSPENPSDFAKSVEELTGKLL